MSCCRCFKVDEKLTLILRVWPKTLDVCDVNPITGLFEHELRPVFPSNIFIRRGRVLSKNDVNSFIVVCRRYTSDDPDIVRVHRSNAGENDVSSVVDIWCRNEFRNCKDEEPI